MPRKRVQKFLDDNGVKYVVLEHSPAYTAMEVAHAAHIPGRELAKTVVVKLDGNMALAVVSSSEQVALDALMRVAGAKRAELASEGEFASLFPDCEPGAMPPFGNLYNLPVYVDNVLATDEQIAFSAGTHHDLIRMSYTDFARLANPKKGRFGVKSSGTHAA